MSGAKRKTSSWGRMGYAVRLGAVGLAAAAGCQDLPTKAPDSTSVADPVSLTQSGRPRPRAGQFACVATWRTMPGSTRWDSREFSIIFPQSERNASGLTVQYQHRLISADGRLRAAADCEVPYTEAALRRIDHRFGVHRGGGAEQFKEREEGVSTQGCVTEGSCTLEPIVVQPPPEEECSGCSEPSPPPGYTDDGSGGGGAGGGETTDDGFVPHVAPGDDNHDRDVPPDCGTTTHEIEVAWCSGYVPTGDLLTKIRSAIARIKSRGSVCNALATRAEGMLAAGHFRITNSTYPDWAAAAGRGGDWAIFTRQGIDVAGERAIDWIINHEMDHSAGNTSPGVTDSHGHMLGSDGVVDPYNTMHSKSCSNIIV